jgi:hypothetical protein
MSKAAEMTQKSLQVVFLVDITGSMGSQIEGVKQMIAKFCEIDRPFVDIHIWTFTENPGCHVSKSPVGLKSEGLVKYTKDITLCHPPDNPTINASGGDGPENVTAGIASLVDSFDINDNLLCFIITDAPPHCKCFGEGAETLDERKWLENAGFDDTDVFIVLCQVIDSLNVTFVPVLYGDSRRSVWFHQAAVMTEGLVLCPKQASSEALAGGLGVLLDTFQRLSVSRDLNLLRTINTEDLSGGFGILDIDPDDFQMVEEDQGKNDKVHKDYKEIGDSEQLAERIAAPFRTAIDRFAGKKAATRCRGVSADQVAASVRVLLRGFQFILGSGNFDQVEVDVNNLMATLQVLAAKERNIEWDVKKLENFKKYIKSVKEKGEGKTFTHQEDLPVNPLVIIDKLVAKIIELNPKPYSELDVSNWMDLVLQMILIRFIDVKFATDATGKEDFGDAWSASLGKIDYSGISTASAAISSRPEGENTYISLASSEKFNSALIFAPPSSSLLSEFYKLLGFFPTLQGLIQSHLVSGGYKIFPSMSIGLQSATLWHLIRIREKGPNFNQGEWDLLRSLAHSFEVSDIKPGLQLYRAAKKGLALNPVDSISKVFAGILTFFRKHSPETEKSQQVLRLLFEEYSAEVVSYELKKDGPELRLPTEKQLASLIIESTSITDFDPLSGQHYLEEVLKRGKRLEDSFILKVKSHVSSNSVITGALNVFKTAIGLFVCNLKTNNCEEAFNDAKVLSFQSLCSDELLFDVFIESLLVKKRTARYKLDEGSKEWLRISLEPLNISALHDRCVEILKEEFREQVNQWNLKRKAAGLAFLTEKVLNLPAGSFESCNESLKSLEYSIDGFSLKLCRSDVLDVLNQINEEDKLRTLGLALVIGDWTNSPPGDLRKSLRQVLQKFQFSEELSENIKSLFKKTVECLRNTTAPNRHGHTKDLKFPGPHGWTQEYDDEVRKNKKRKVKKLEKHLEELKDYTSYHIDISEILKENNLKENQKVLIDWCINGHSEIRILNKVKNFVERLKIARIEKNEKIDWDFKTKDLLKKLNSSKHPWKHLDQYLKSAEKSEE